MTLSQYAHGIKSMPAVPHSTAGGMLIINSKANIITIEMDTVAANIFFDM